MILFNSIGSGFIRSLRSWKGVIVIWFLTIFLISVFTTPLKAGLKKSFGKSMITEKLADGFDIEVFTDLGSSLGIMSKIMIAGLFTIFLSAIVMNAFLAGGLFGSLRKESGRFSIPDFFGQSVKNFWSFLGISLIMKLIMLFLTIFLIGIPVSILSINNSLPEESMALIVFIFILIYLFALPLLFLVSDYARAWQVTSERSSCFKAIGTGFNRTFREFRVAYPLMVIISVVQLLVLFPIVALVPGWRPVTGAGTLFLFLVSQLLFFTGLLLKTWRFAGVTVLFEHTDPMVK